MSVLNNSLFIDLENNLFSRFCFSPTNSIKREIAKLDKENLGWTEERKNLVIEALKSKNFHSCAWHLKKICQRLDPKHLHHLLKAASDLSVNSDLKANPQCLHNLKNLLTLEQIEAAVHAEYPSFETAIDAAKNLSGIGKLYLDITHPPQVKPLLNRLVTNIIWIVDTIIEMILSTLGITSFQNENDNDYDNMMRWQATMAAFTVLTSLVTLTVALVGTTAAAAAIVGSGVIIAGVAIGVYYNFLKPVPRYIKGCSNLTAQANGGYMPHVEGRQHYYDELANALLSSKGRPKTHPLLIGPTGVGKTEIMKGFAQAVAEGRYEGLKGKQVFYINAAELPPHKTYSYRSPITLEKIQEKIRFNRHGVILIIDEIHQAARGKDGSLVERLKSMLDEGEEGFPFVIAATTDKEYEKYISPNDALARRFKLIPIKEMSKDQTLDILNKMVLQNPGLQATKETIEYVYELSRKFFPEKPQPYMAARILAQAISRATDTQFVDLETKISEEEAVLGKIFSSQLLENDFGFPNKEVSEEINRINKHIEELKQHLKEEKLKSENLKQLLSSIENCKKEICTLLDKLSLAPSDKHPKLTAMLKEFSILKFYVNKSLDEKLQKQAAVQGGHFAHITKEMIDQIVNKEVALRKEKEEMIHPASGKKHAVDEEDVDIEIV